MISLKYNTDQIKKFLLSNGYLIKEITASNSDDIIICAIKEEFVMDDYNKLPHVLLFKYEFRNVFENLFKEKLFDLLLNHKLTEITTVNS